MLETERPDALLPTLGGQTALNLAVALHENGTLERLGVELIGATVDAVRRAESRVEFTRTCRAAGLDLPRGVEVGSVTDGLAAVDDLRQHPTTAVVAYNDLMAIGLIEGLDALGVRVPQEVSVVGFDDIPDAASYLPPLTRTR